ncbi:unnamed protein product [Closterium sp. Yama58-4]|nr:unnamed protein product [Closterium sp. Yama58-4]
MADNLKSDDDDRAVDSESTEQFTGVASLQPASSTSTTSASSTNNGGAFEGVVDAPRRAAGADRRFSCSAVTPAGLAAGNGIAIGGGGAAAAAAAAALSAAVAAAAAASAAAERSAGGSNGRLTGYHTGDGSSLSASGSESAALRPPAALFSVAESGSALAAAALSSSPFPAQKSLTGAVAAGARRGPATGRAARPGSSGGGGGGGGDCNRGGGRGMARTAEKAEFDLSVPAKARKSMSGSGRRASLDYSDLEAVRERVQQAAALWALAEDRERDQGNQASDTDDDDEEVSSSSSSSSAGGKQQEKLSVAVHQGSNASQQQQHKSISKLASQSHSQGGAVEEAGNQGRAKGPSRSKSGARGSLIRRWLNFGRS